MGVLTPERPRLARSPTVSRTSIGHREQMPRESPFGTIPASHATVAQRCDIERASNRDVANCNEDAKGFSSQALFDDKSQSTCLFKAESGFDSSFWTYPSSRSIGEPNNGSFLQIDSGLFQDIPTVYQTAIAAAQRFGWHEIHGRGPEWTALHWAASEGRFDICETLLRTAADPHQP